MWYQKDRVKSVTNLSLCRTRKVPSLPLLSMQKSWIRRSAICLPSFMRPWNQGSVNCCSGYLKDDKNRICQEFPLKSGVYVPKKWQCNNKKAIMCGKIKVFVHLPDFFLLLLVLLRVVQVVVGDHAVVLIPPLGSVISQVSFPCWCRCSAQRVIPNWRLNFLCFPHQEWEIRWHTSYV